MLTFDPKSRSISKKSAAKKSGSKGDASGVKFSPGKKISQLNNTEELRDVEGVADVSPMLFMQEMEDDNKDDQEDKKLQAFGKNAIKHLKLLQLALTSGTLQESHLRNLQQVIDQQDLSFASKEHQQLANEIATRIAVEIAKLEMAKVEK